jgi:hypothetical protein
LTGPERSGIVLLMNAIEIAEKVVAEGAMVFRERVGEPGVYDAKPYFSGNKRGWIAMDSFSASAIVAVYKALNEQNKARFAALNPVTAAKVAFKFVK